MDGQSGMVHYQGNKLDEKYLSVDARHTSSRAAVVRPRRTTLTASRRWHPRSRARRVDGPSLAREGPARPSRRWADLPCGAITNRDRPAARGACWIEAEWFVRTAGTGRGTTGERRVRTATTAYGRERRGWNGDGPRARVPPRAAWRNTSRISVSTPETRTTTDSVLTWAPFRWKYWSWSFWSSTTCLARSSRAPRGRAGAR